MSDRRDTTQFNLRAPRDLWARVKARAASENPPGHSFDIHGKLLYLLDVYARIGWAELVKRCAAASLPSSADTPGAAARDRARDGDPSADPR